MKSAKILLGLISLVFCAMSAGYDFAHAPTADCYYPPRESKGRQNTRDNDWWKVPLWWEQQAHGTAVPGDN